MPARFRHAAGFTFALFCLAAQAAWSQAVPDKPQSERGRSDLGGDVSLPDAEAGGLRPARICRDI